MYTRAPEHDRRFARGDDYAADGWRDTDTGQIIRVAVGHDPNPPLPVSAYTCLGCRRPLPRGRGGHCDACVEWADAPPPALPDEPPGVPGEDTDPSAPPDLDPAPGRSPDAGAAIYRQFHRDRHRFLTVLRGLDRDAWCILAEAYCAYLLRHGARLTPNHILSVWSKAVSGDIALPPRVHPLLVEADASAESYRSKL